MGEHADPGLHLPPGPSPDSDEARRPRASIVRNISPDLVAHLCRSTGPLAMRFESLIGLSHARGRPHGRACLQTDQTGFAVLLTLPSFRKIQSGSIAGRPGCQAQLNQDAAHWASVTTLYHNHSLVIRGGTDITARCVPTLHTIYRLAAPPWTWPPPIVRRAASPVIRLAVKQIEYPPPICFLPLLLPCTHHRLVLPPFLSLDTFVRHIALHFHFGSG
jgi:hypothetical protein